MGNKITYHSMFEAKKVINEIVDQTEGFHAPRIFLRVGLVFCEMLLLESRKVVDVISQMAALVNKGQDVSLEVAPIKELQLVCRYL